MRENISLECTQCGNRNYRTSREMKNTPKLSIKKYCKHCRTHVIHKEKKK
ncbi:MAG: 50S ribosomal protein L33 [Planctomycetota bacterium]